MRTSCVGHIQGDLFLDAEPDWSIFRTHPNRLSAVIITSIAAVRLQHLSFPHYLKGGLDL